MGRIYEISILLVIGLVAIMSMVTFVADLSVNYNVEMPANVSVTAQDTIKSLNKTSNTIVEIVSAKDTSWINTLYDIFFALPASALSGVTDMVSLSFNFMSEMSNSTTIPLPTWIIPVILIIITLIVAFGVVSIALKWNV